MTYVVSLILATMMAGFATALQAKYRLAPVGAAVDLPSPIFRQRQRDWLLFLCFGVLYAVAALRYNTWTDYQSYSEIYYWAWTGADWLKLEPGFYALIRFLAQFTRSPQWMFAIASLVYMGPAFLTLRDFSENYAVSVFLFVTMGFYLNAGAIRQYIAVGLCFWGYRLLLQKRYLFFMAIMIVGLLFHYSALIMLIFPILNRRYHPGIYFIMGAASAAMLFLSNQIMTIVTFIIPRYTFYLNYSRSFSFFHSLFSVVVLLLCYYYRKPILEKDPRSILLLNIAYVTALCRLFLNGLPLLDRVMVYFEIFALLTLTKVIAVENRAHYKALYVVGICLYGIFFFFYSYIIKNNSIVMPYQSVLFSEVVRL